MIDLKPVRLSFAALTLGALFACTPENTKVSKKRDTERPQVSLQLNLPQLPASLLLADEAAQVLNLVLRTTSANGETKLVPFDVKNAELELDAPTGKVVFEALYLVGVGGAAGFEKSVCDLSHTTQYFFARAKNTVDVREEGQLVALDFGNLAQAKTTLLAVKHSNAIDSKVAWVDPVLKAPLNSGCASKSQDWSWGTESNLAKMRVPLLGESSSLATGQPGFVSLSSGVFELKGLTPSDDRIFGFSTKTQAADAAPGAGESIPEESFSPEFLKNLLPLPVVTLEVTEEIAPRAVVAKGSCGLEGSDVILSGASLTSAVAKCENKVYQAKLAAGSGPLSRLVKVNHANRLGGVSSVEQTLVLTAPVVSDVTNKSTNEDVPLSAIPFTVANAGSSLNCATSVVVSSSNPTLLPTANISVGGKVPNCTVGLTPAAQQSGTTTVTLAFDDGTLPASDSFILTVNAENVAPILTSSAPATNTPAQAAMIFSGSCETGLMVWFTGSGVASNQSLACAAGSYSGSINLSAGDGVKSIALSQTDAAGNVSAPLVVVVRRDNVAPVSTLSTPSVATANSTANVTFTVSFSDDVGLNTVSLANGDVTLNSTGGASCSKAVSGSGTGSRTVTLSSCTGDGTVGISLPAGMATDLAGNTSLAPGASSTFTVDNTGPALAVTMPSNNASVSTNFTVTGTCETGFAVQISGPITSSPVSAVCSGNVFSQTLTLTGPDGTKVLSFSTIDAAVNLAGTSLSVVKDSLAPALSISSPASNTILGSTNGATILEGMCEPGLIVTLEGSDVPAGQTTTCPSGSYSFAAGAWSVNSGDGTKTVVVSQTDASENKGTANVAVVLNTSLPPPANFSAVSLVNGLKYSFTGTCDSSASFALTSVTSNIGNVVSSSCVANVLRANVSALPEGINTLTLTATMTRISNTLTRVTTANFNQQFFCPQGYVGVPGKFATDSDTAGLGNVNATAGNADGGLDPTRDFCVMKYQAKVATSNASGQSAWEPVYDGNKPFTIANYWPQSRADSTPWVNISRDNAADRCKALNEAHGLCSGASCTSFDNSAWGYRLMSNTQWQVAARNMEKTGGNWTSGTVGTGFLWRGHSDDAPGPSTDLHTQTYLSGGSKALSNPRRDTGSDYFGTGNSVSQSSTGTSGWEERRRFVLSNSSSVWDFAGNVWQLVSDNNCNGKGVASTTPSCASDMGVNGNSASLDSTVVNTGVRAAGTWWEYLNGGITGIDKLLFSSSGDYTSSKNAGQIHGASAGAVYRGGNWTNPPTVGLFSAALNSSASYSNGNSGFRCAFLPPLAPTAPLDTVAPSAPNVGRVDGAGNGVSNAAVTVAAGGLWHLAITNVTDSENTGTNATKLRVKVRRKIATANNDFPTTAEPVYRAGYNSPSLFNRPDTNDLTQQTGFISVTDGKLYLSNESAWIFNETTGQYTRNDGKFVNYRIEVYDPAGNSSSATYSVQNTQSCPPGYVGVPGKNSGDSDTPGLGNGLAAAGNTNLQLDPTKAFCVMKYPAKVMSAGTTAANTTVGGRFEPIMNGNNTFTNTYSYNDSSTFNSQVKYLPSSRYSGTPWVNINRDNSIKACRALQMQYFGTLPDTGSVTGGAGFQLMSNTQWQVVARNAELVASNWSGNAVGSGSLARGHTDDAISATGGTGATEPLNSWCFGCSAPFTSLSGLPNAILDLNGYFATGNSATGAWNTLTASPAAGTQELRTRSLSNGNTVWDFGGNVWNWVADNNSCANTATAGLGGCMGASTGVRGINTWAEYSSGSITASDRLLFSSFGNYTSSKNAGQVYGSAAGAVLRGGNWYGTFSVGLFGAFLFSSATSSSNDIGFRCAFQP